MIRGNMDLLMKLAGMVDLAGIEFIGTGALGSSHRHGALRNCAEASGKAYWRRSAPLTNFPRVEN